VICRVRPSFSRLSRLSAGLLLLSAAACSSATDTTTTTYTVATSITIEPSSFLGAVACSSQPGALKSYVATLSEITDGQPSVTLASSPPMPCSQAVSFRYVQEGRTYTVAVDGYDVPASDLVPCGGEESGSRYMLLAATAPDVACAAALTGGSVPVAPRWRTSCGDVPSHPITEASITAACDRPLEGQAPTGPTTITLDPREALGMLACVADGGAITRFDIKADDPGQTNHLGLDCATFGSLDPLTHSYAKNLVPGTKYTFHVSAHAVGEPPGSAAYVAECSAVARAGLSVAAVCEPFTQP
jgi:hypothetical protein